MAPQLGTDARPGNGRTAYAELTLPPLAESAAKARRFLRETFAGWDIGDATITVGELLVSELVTNSILHARTEFTLRLHHNGAIVRVGVSDGDPRNPVRRRVHSDDLAGRGLDVVDHLVGGRWETVADGYGKTVWCELDVVAT